MQPAKAVCGDPRYTGNGPTGSMGTHLMQPAKAVPSGSKKRRMQSGVVTHATASQAMLSVQQSMQVGRPAGWIRGRRGQGGVGVWGGDRVGAPLSWFASCALCPPLGPIGPPAMEARCSGPAPAPYPPTLL